VNWLVVGCIFLAVSALVADHEDYGWSRDAAQKGGGSPKGLTPHLTEHLN